MEALVLTIGNETLAKIIEVIEDRQGEQVLIVGVEGHLIRMKNETNKRIQVGEQIRLVVISQNPLGFRILEGPLREKHRSFERWR